MTELITEEGIDKPPFLKRWRTIYAIVVGILVGIIVIFHLFSEAFS
jgi:hypothetical protein